MVECCRTTENGATDRSIISNQGAIAPSVSYDSYSVVNAGRSDGVYRVRLVSLGTSPYSESIVFRMTDQSNWIGIRRISSADLRWRLVNTVAGTGTDVANPSTGFSMTNNTVFVITLSGQNVKVEINGAVLFDGIIADNVTGTKFGVGGTLSSSSARFDDISLKDA